ncbi:hypothetical protein ABRP55_20200 [Pectobacterium zantedeschiae]|uniref:hypothetical protein n=1 Tax=Pectobacterium zantedeschiae TaxID=2034769 RepID=UPI0032EE2369
MSFYPNNIGRSKAGAKGDPGDDAQNIELTSDEESIKWKLEDDSTWTVLIPLSELSGEPGNDGRTAEFSVSEGYIKWRWLGDDLWTNLIAVSALKGGPGDNGLSVELQTTTTHIQWRQTDGGWQNLISLSSLQGDSGPVNALGIGTVSTLAAGTQATATITGTYPDQKLNLGLPQGAGGTNATTTAVATQSVNGLMSSADKTKLDGIQAQSATAIASGGRPIGTAFTVHATRNARVTYSISYALSATLVIGQTLQIIAAVDGVEVARISDAILLGLAGTLNRNESISFFVPAGKQVLLTKTGTAAVVASVSSGQETLL